MILPHLVEVPVERAEHVLGILHSQRLHALEVLEVLARHPAAEEGLDLGGHVMVVQHDLLLQMLLDAGELEATDPEASPPSADRGGCLGLPVEAFPGQITPHMALDHPGGLELFVFQEGELQATGWPIAGLGADHRLIPHIA